MTQVAVIPEGVKQRPNGEYYREVTQKVLDRKTGVPLSAETGKPIEGWDEMEPEDQEACEVKLRTVERPVALTLLEAKRTRFDYFHPGIGWILEGYKRATDISLSDLMADNSVGGQRSPGRTLNA